VTSNIANNNFFILVIFISLRRGALSAAKKNAPPEARLGFGTMAQYQLADDMVRHAVQRSTHGTDYFLVRSNSIRENSDCISIALSFSGEEAF
jgi:hypothetical protein